MLCLVTQSCPTLQPHGLQPSKLRCPWGSTRQEYWSGLPCPLSRDLPNPGIVPRSPALQVDSLPSEPPGKPKINFSIIKKKIKWWSLSFLDSISRALKTWASQMPKATRSQVWCRVVHSTIYLKTSAYREMICILAQILNISQYNRLIIFFLVIMYTQSEKFYFFFL